MLGLLNFALGRVVQVRIRSDRLELVEPARLDRYVQDLVPKGLSKILVIRVDDLTGYEPGDLAMYVLSQEFCH